MTTCANTTRGMALAALLAVGLAIVPNAAALTYDAGTQGTSAGSGYSFSATGGSLGLKTVAGYTGLGITGGASGSEIDLNQSLTINFTSSQTIDYLTIAFLYNGPEFGDTQEKAKIVADGVSYYLQVLTDTTASWTGIGTPINLSPATLEGGGVWNLVNPFSDTSIKSIKLTPVNLPSQSGNNSDFSLLGFGTHRTGTRVPDGGTTVGLLGLALLGLPFVRKQS